MTTDWKDVESKYYMFVVRRQPVVIVKGDGTKVWDVDGKEYLDFTSGWAVNNAGHANEAIANAISEQARTLLQTSNQFYTVPQLQLAEVLVENSALDKVFFCNSGAEANEGAMKLARRYGAKNKNGAFRDSDRAELVPRAHDGERVGDRAASLPGTLPADTARVQARGVRRPWKS